MTGVPAEASSRSRRRRPNLAVGGLVTLVASLLVFGAIAAAVGEHQTDRLDAAMTSLLHGLAMPVLDAFMQTVTQLGSNLVIVPLLAVALILLIWTRRQSAAVFLAASAIGSIQLSAPLKLVFERQRPQLPWAQAPSDYSFPSGHAMDSFVFYVALGLIAWWIWGRRAGVVAIGAGVALALLIGSSRIYLGFHYFTDVIGGYLAGLAWLLVVAAAVAAWPRLTRSRSAGGRNGQ
jgi:undecaprenyl-diphosphatase